VDKLSCEHQAAVFWGLRASLEYTENADFINTPGMYQKASDHYNKMTPLVEAADRAIADMTIPDHAKERLRQTDENFRARIALGIAGALGMKCLTEGEIALATIDIP